MNKVIPFDQLNTATLMVDTIYEGGTAGNTGDDPLSKLLHCGNQGGFRKVGTSGVRYVVLYSSLDEGDWPDSLDTSTGIFTYYGDNRTPGHLLHSTPRGGNLLLSQVFDMVHSSPSRRSEVPPFFIFTKSPTNSSRSVQFRGLAVPGGQGLTSTDDLVAVWKSKSGQRFQNYRATFTILDVASISRAWLDDLFAGKPTSANTPAPWLSWVNRGIYKPLQAQPTINYRTEADQVPLTQNEKDIGLTQFTLE